MKNHRADSLFSSLASLEDAENTETTTFSDNEIYNLQNEILKQSKQIEAYIQTQKPTEQSKQMDALKYLFSIFKTELSVNFSLRKQLINLKNENSEMFSDINQFIQDFQGLGYKDVHDFQNVIQIIKKLKQKLKKNKKLQNALSQTLEENEQLHEMLEDLKREAKEKEKDKQQQKEPEIQITTLDNNNKEKELNDEILRLKQELQLSQMKNERLEKENEQIKSDNEQVKRENTDLKAEKQQLLNQNHSFTEKITSLVNTIEKSNNEKDKQINKKQDQVQAPIQVQVPVTDPIQEQKLKESEALCNQLKNENFVLQNKIEQLQNQMNMQKQLFEAAKSQTPIFDPIKEQKLRESEFLCNQLKNENSILQSKIEQLQAQKNVPVQIPEPIKVQVPVPDPAQEQKLKENEILCNKLKNENFLSQNKIDQLQSENLHLQKKIKQFQNENKQLQSEIESLSDENNKIKSDSIQKEQEYQQNKKNFSLYETSQKEFVESQQLKYEEQIKALRNEILNSEREKGSLQAEIALLNNELMKKEDEHRTAFEEYQTELQKLKNDFSNQEISQTQIYTDSQLLRKQIDEQTQFIEEKENTIQSQNGIIKKLKAKLDVIKKKNEEQDATIKELREELSNLSEIEATVKNINKNKKKAEKKAKNIQSQYEVLIQNNQNEMDSLKTAQQDEIKKIKEEYERKIREMKEKCKEKEESIRKNLQDALQCQISQKELIEKELRFQNEELQGENRTLRDHIRKLNYSLQKEEEQIAKLQVKLNLQPKNRIYRSQSDYQTNDNLKNLNNDEILYKRKPANYNQYESNDFDDEDFGL